MTLKVQKLNQPFNTSARVRPSRAGDGETRMPAASMAAVLDSASPFPPAMMAPAWPMRGRGGATGDEPDHGLGPAALGLINEKLGGILLGGAPDLADHDDGLRGLVGQ